MTCKGTAAVAMIGATRQTCVLPGSAANVFLAGVPRIETKLHRLRPGRRLPHRATSFFYLFAREPTLSTTRKETSTAGRLWICGRVPPRLRRARTGPRPPDRMDKPWISARTLLACANTLPTACPHSLTSRPQLHSLNDKFFFTEFGKEEKRHQIASRFVLFSQAIHPRLNVGQKHWYPTNQCGIQHLS